MSEKWDELALGLKQSEKWVNLTLVLKQSKKWDKLTIGRFANVWNMIIVIVRFEEVFEMRQVNIFIIFKMRQFIIRFEAVFENETN
jgi:hypothetical protein